jgi:hypothetical protein
VVIVGVIVAVILINRGDKTPEPSPTGPTLTVDVIDFELDVEYAIWEQHSADVWIDCGLADLVLQTGKVFTCDMWDLEEDSERSGPPGAIEIEITDVDAVAESYDYEYREIL